MHLKAILPPPPVIITPEVLPYNWESQIPLLIGQIQTQENFPRLYKTWLILHRNELLERERFAWLSCLAYYVNIDTNKNGIPDWTAIVDNEPTRILYPQDPDMDGDGSSNVLDPSPLDAKIKANNLAFKLPNHLKLDLKNNSAAYKVQKKLFTEFGIVAIDHTDSHSSVVLLELLKLLESAFPRNLVSNLKGLRHIYAFLSHDSLNNIASFHREANAISIGGHHSYSERPLSPPERVDLVAALAHEIGHVYLFEKLSALKLADLAERFGGWKGLARSDISSFYSQVFFMPSPFQTLYLNATDQELKRKNVISEYAMTNIHEWFAESFSAVILFNLGSASYFGPIDWQKLLVKSPQRHFEYWNDYNKVSMGFRLWLNARLYK